MRWITAHHLEEWARRTTISSRDLPKVVGDLVRASCPDIASFRFPSGDKGQVRGFDGHLETTSGGLNVPEGRSYWEFKISRDYKREASAEFERVSRMVPDEVQRDTEFVFVSPWTWDSSDSKNKLEDWESSNSRKYQWKAVRYIDGVKLESWLEACQAVSAWHAKNTFDIALIDSARSTDEFWDQFRNYFDPPLTEDVLLCERDDQSEQLIKALLGGPDRISFSADAPDEVIAFAIAAIRKAKPEIRLFLEARTIVVDNMTAGRMLLTERNLIYLLRGDAADAPGQFVSRGPSLVPLGRYQRTGARQALHRPSGQMMGIAMKTMGIPETMAITLARGCGRSLTVLMRHRPGGRCQPPAWMPNRDIVLPAILSGGWDTSNELDLRVVQGIAEADDYLRYERKLRTFLDGPDPPLEREGTVWKVRAPIDAFVHIGELIGADHIELLRSAMSAVFSHIEPEPNPREIIRLSSPPSRHSEWLRDGLATTLLLIAAWEKQAGLTLGVGAGQRFADELVDSLPGLRTNYRLLASLRNELPLLAEAAPSPLLASLEHMLEGNGEAIRPLFVEVEGFLSPIAYHTGLLWALETLAWDPEYFHRSVKILARLAAIDPGGRIGNRPINSLREIFILWNPNTNASSIQRMAALDDIAESLPEIGWRLICMLLPSLHGVSSPTARPRLREAGASERPPVTYQELWENQSAVVRRAIRLAGKNVSRWIELISVIPIFRPDDQTLAYEEVNAALASCGEDERQPLWEKIRDEVLKHEKFATAAWALSPDQLRPLRVIIERYKPSDPIPAVAWLFDTWMLDSHSSQDAADKRRVDALRALLADHDLVSVLRLGLEVKLPHTVVQALSAAGASRNQIESLLMDSVRADPTSDFPANLATLHREVAGERESEAWLASAMRTKAWGADTMARLLMGWPNQTSTWHFARHLGDEVATNYWKRLGPHWIKGSKRELLRAVLSLLNVGRGRAALGTAFNRLGEVPTRLIYRILDSIMEELSREETQTDSSWELENAFAELDRRVDASDVEVVKREFVFFRALEYGNRPLRLHKVMASDPESYYHLLCLVFRGKHEEIADTEPTQADRARAQTSYALLSKFTLVPGQSANAIDAASLAQWIDRLRELAASADRSDVADAYIGHVLAHSIQDSDGGWPHRVVRDEIERLASESVESGLHTERFNMRGAHWKSLYGGGIEERGFAAQNRGYAEKAAAWPRTARMLREIAKSWDAHAEYEDVAANQRKLRS